MFVVLPDLPVEHHDQLGQVLIIGFPFLKSTVVSVANRVDTEIICDAKVLPEGSERFIPAHLFDVPARDAQFDVHLLCLLNVGLLALNP